MKEMSKLGWLIRLVKHATGVNLFYFLYLLLLSISKILASSQAIQALHRLDGLILIFLEDPLSDCTYDHEAAQLNVWLFCQCS
jgi:succinate dehydrogenase/fumarate reductase cytochrome b subunit